MAENPQESRARCSIGDGRGGTRAAAAPFDLHVDDRDAIREEMRHYEDPRGASIAALKIVQQRHGWVPDGALSEIAKLLGVSVDAVNQAQKIISLLEPKPGRDYGGEERFLFHIMHGFGQRQCRRVHRRAEMNGAAAMRVVVFDSVRRRAVGECGVDR